MIASARSGRPPSMQGAAAVGPMLAVLLCVAGAARAQQPTTEVAPPAQTQQAVPADATSPAAPHGPRRDGFFQAFGRWLDGSFAGVYTPWRGRSQASPSDAQKGTEIDLLSKTKIVSGRERCETAANGAPDCHGAIEALCRSRGLAAGGSLDIQSVQKCPARVWISGTQPKAGECRMESYVQRAFCQ
jgi:hypothetical protein